MTDIEQKALALVNEVLAEWGVLKNAVEVPKNSDAFARALLLSIEQHEAFRQEVSDAVVKLNRHWERYEPAKVDFYARFDRFIIPKPVDPLVEAVAECDDGTWETKAEYSNKLRAAIEKRGGKIVWGEGQ